jgi:beta-lactamase regulating signal transducer with metallopeptidase domain
MMLETLARASIEGAGFVCAIWIISRALPRLPAAAKATLWWCAAAKVVVALGWGTQIGVPVLPATNVRIHPLVALVEPSSGNVAEHDVPVSTGRTSEAGGVGWTWFFMGVWTAGLCASAGLAVRGWREARWVIRRSVSADASLQQCAREIAALLALRHAPEVRLSADVESPLITGVWRPLILVPDRRFMELPREQQRMALCHELAHVRRGDVWLGCVPAVAERIFFFHPLVRLAAREYAFWREAACDAAVLAALGTVPQAYGRLLLDLGVAKPPVTLAAAGAPWSFSNLKRRIVMLNQPHRPSMPARIVGAAVLATALVAIAPLKLVARPSAEPAAASPSVSFSVSVPVAAPVAGPVLAPVPAPVPEAPGFQSAQRKPDEGPHLTFVFFLNDDQSTMSGSTADIARARRFRSGDGQLLWFRKDGREYVVRDAGVLREVQAIWDPVSQLGDEQGQVGAKQGTLGSRQGDIGAKQGELGAEQGRLGARQGILGARQGTLAAREALGFTSADRAQLEREHQAIDQEMRALDQQMRALTDKMRDLDKPMRSLGDEMEVLSREMEVLSGKMGDASRQANAAMRELIERAIANGTAQAVQ